MASILKNLRLLADPSRLRILLLVEREELSVAELQEILSMGQSRISTHLAQLKQAGILEDRRNGKSILYRLHANGETKTFEKLLGVLRQAAAEMPESAQDSDALTPRHQGGKSERGYSQDSWRCWQAGREESR